MTGQMTRENGSAEFEDPRPVRRVRVVDSHTGGEATRVVVEGGPDLGRGPLSARLELFRTAYDRFRSALVCEPRGTDAMVGALLGPSESPRSKAGVIFFDNAGYLGMCGHGLMGLVATLAHLGRVGPGVHGFDTPVGRVEAGLDVDGRVAVRNVASYRSASGVTVEVPGHGPVVGDVAWGGNWFFLVDGPSSRLSPRYVAELTGYAWAIRHALKGTGVTGTGGQEIDHIALFGSSDTKGVDSRNFVLCPGGSYDRSPCGTGTSAKMACLHEDGKLREGDVWRQESIVGSVFEGSIARVGGQLRPTITGSAHVTGEAELILDDRDPFCWGIPR